MRALDGLPGAVLLLPQPLRGLAAVLLAMMCLMLWPIDWAMEKR